MFSFTVILLLVEFALRILLAFIILLRRELEPNTRLSWLMVVLLLPIGGTIAYFLVGEVRLGTKRVARHREVVLKMSDRARRPHGQAPPATPTIGESVRQIAWLAESVGGNLPSGGNRLQVLGDAEETIDLLVRDIDAARDHCHLLAYIYLPDGTGDRVGEALMRARRRGVCCRVLVDAAGSRDFLRSALAARMQAAGVELVAALPVNALRAFFARIDVRNHRKIFIADGSVGYMGSRNVADAAFAPKKRYAPWVDVMVRIEGPVVADLQQLFVEDWYLDTDEWLGDLLGSIPPPLDGGVSAQVIGTGPSLYSFAMRQVHHAAIHLAREELIITTPYFVPDDATVSAVLTAARRGVRTHLVLPARNDSRLVAAASRGFYESLLDAGVRIHEYQHGLLHSKTLTVDRDLALVTSANLDKRSFFLNFEASLIVYDTDFASELRFLQRGYMDASHEITADVWTRHRWPRRLVHNAAGILSPLL